ncbi:ABC transporter permease [Sphingomonas baiyangensis]|uniref:FtsX-like permease family protein n=1 Tax=Sphingomonas baiyangensis TaxID=2572576 RepID=A0A4U1L2J6_9SPHN|nr:FtsX-like permease family protein [Sphingomonas baiyangensis]TKD50403.1 FtsX-like permease family protein [Sphingomonas baiyangensis]
MSDLGWAASWRIARRDLHRGFHGLRLLFICLLLGVATLATIGSLTAGISAELAARGRVILGGDIEVAMMQRRADAAETGVLAQLGTLSDTVRTRAMAQADARADSPGAVLTELKGVDAAYPLYGTLTLASGRAYAPLAPGEVLIDRALAERLLLSPGDTLRYGTADFTVRDLIASEPDRVGEGFTLGPVAIVSNAGFARTGLIQPGALFETKLRVALPPGIEPQAAVDAIEARFPAGSFEYKTRDRAAPGADRFFQRMGQFLQLIGLAALVIAGIGVGNGVGSYLAGKRDGIATLKVLGASSRDIARIYLLQIGAVALLAVVLALAIGALLPPAIVAALGDLLPVRPGFALYPLPLATSAAYGLLIAIAFALPPLARARMLPAATLFRGLVAGAARPDRRTVIAVAVAAIAVLVLAIATARDPLFAAAVLGAVALTLALLLLLGGAVRRFAAHVPRPRRPLWRLAIANLHRPGAQTAALVIALGLALTLFVTLAAIQTSLAEEIRTTVPDRAPNQFVLDVPSDQRARFDTVVRGAAPEAEMNVVPSLRGTIVAFGDTRVADLEELPDGAWFLRGERGVTYSPTLPEGSDLTDGAWWPADYAGPPLVSLDREAAVAMGVGVGDTLTVSILGREIPARIASLREIHWETLGFNYIMVFSPSALESAPHSLTATIQIDKANEGAVARALLAAFPSASIIAVDEVIGQVRTILDQMATAIVLAASVAILAGIAVLVGAIAASRQARAYDSVILKTLGATRTQILGAQAIEYALLALLLAAIALALGGGAAWYVITQVFEFGWAPDWGIVLATLAGGALLTLGIGLAGSWPILSVRPAQALRRV